MELDLLDDGRASEHGGTVGGRSAWLRRAVVGVAVAAVGVAAYASLKAPTPAATAVPAPSATALAQPVRLLDDQFGFTTDKQSFTLQVSVVNYGSRPIQVLLTRLPQAGAKPLNGPGGDLPFAQPTTLAPGVPTYLEVTARVSCPAVLVAPLADHLDVTVGHDGQPTGVVSLSLEPLGTTIDDARHRACGVDLRFRCDLPDDAGDIGAAGHVGGRTSIESALVLKNLTPGEAHVTVVGTLPAGLTVERADGGREPYPVPAGPSSVLLLRWTVTDCASVQAVQWPQLKLQVALPTSVATLGYGFDPQFGAAWQKALAHVCRPAG